MTGPVIVISNRQRAKKIDLQLFKKITAAALEELKIQKADLGIILVNANASARLNEEYLGHHGPTDVITFDYQSPEAKIDKPELQGEIFICVEQAQRQSRQFGTSWREEIARYIVHGILHLMGHDDLRAAARRRMKLIEGRLVRKLSRRFALSKL